MKLTSMRSLAATVAASGAIGLAFAGTAQATNVAVGHYDLKVNIDCRARTAPLLAENHVTEVESSLDSLLFEVNSTNSVASTSNDRARFGSAPFRVLTHDDSLFSTNLIIGVEAAYTNCRSGSLPQVTYRVLSSTVPSGGRAASYPNTGGSTTQLDTDSGTGHNTGIVTNSHEDRRWGFTASGTYDLVIQASTSFSGGAVTSSDTLHFAVS